MIPLNTSWENYIKDSSVYRMTIEMTFMYAGEQMYTLEFDSDDIVEGSLQIKQGICGVGEFSVGGAVASELRFTLINYDGRFDKLNFSQGIAVVHIMQPSSPGLLLGDYLTLGTFYMEDQKSIGRTIPMVGYDIFGAGQTGMNKPLPNSFAIGTCLSTINSACAYITTLKTTTFPNYNYSLPSVTVDDSWTPRDIVRWVSEVCGCYAFYSSASRHYNGTEYYSDYRANGDSPEYPGICIQGFKSYAYTDDKDGGILAIINILPPADLGIDLVGYNDVYSGINYYSDGNGNYQLTGIAWYDTDVEFDLLGTATIHNGDWLHLLNTPNDNPVTVALVFDDGTEAKIIISSTNMSVDMSSYSGKVVKGIRFYCGTDYTYAEHIHPVLTSVATVTSFVAYDSTIKLDYVDGGVFAEFPVSDSVDGGYFTWLDPNANLYDIDDAIEVTKIMDIPQTNAGRLEITGVSLKAYDDGTVVTVGDASGYCLNIEGNPFIIASNISTVANMIYAEVGGVNFVPFTISCILDPHLEVGDLIKYNDNGTTRGTILTSYDMAIGGLCNMACESSDEASTQF